MEGFGGWPILGSRNGGMWNENSYNLEDLMKRMRNDSVPLPLVNMLVFQDVKNPSKNILTVPYVFGYKTECFPLKKSETSRSIFVL